MRVQQIMTVRPVVATREKNLQEVAELMVEYDCGEIPVVDNEDTMIPVGVITDRDIVCRTVAQGRNPLGLTAGDCMTAPCVTVELHEKVDDCCRVLEEQQLRRVLVVDKAGRLCGIISQADIAEFARPEQTIAVVREVSQRGNGRGTFQPSL
ncbi:MAG TPA: CBS domain-containing protein [Steroidobacteraceae bacterium]|nr:CBS domain-containing protein [Steroidobacteraceae bacterium]